MDSNFRIKFMDLWAKYFVNAPLPVAYYYTNDKPAGEIASKTAGCFITAVLRAWKGEDIILTRESIGCQGGVFYTGFGEMTMPNFNYFLSYGIEGKVRGERYKKTPALVDEIYAVLPKFTAPAKHIVIKRWDNLTGDDNPDVVVFFAAPDVLSGLFTLSNFDESCETNVSAPFSSGCGSIFMWPMTEKTAGGKKGYLGMFDPSARPFIPAGTLSFAITFQRFEQLVSYMEESFLITHDWEKVKELIADRL